MEFPRKRFIELVKKYVHFRRVKEIQENVQRMKMESNINERVLLAMKETKERMIKVHQNTNSPYCFVCIYRKILNISSGLAQNLTVTIYKS